MKMPRFNFLSRPARLITLITLFWIGCWSNANAALFQQVDAGYINSCAIKADSTLGCWGSTSDGQSSPPGGFFSQVSAGGLHSCGISGGTVKCWGDDDFGQSTVPSGSYSQVSAGGNHTCAITSSGSINCWGANNQGQSSASSGTFTHLDTGWQHTCAIRSSGVLSCWGDNYYGQSTPPTGSYTGVTVGTFYSCAINSIGAVVCWGQGVYGQTSPPADSFTHISSGTAHVCGLKTDETLACWGRDNFKQTTPPAGDFVQISAGGTHNCARKSDGNVTCWGSDVYGESSPPNEFPVAPAAPNASDGTYIDKVVISWSSLTNALYYYVYRSSTSGSGGSPISLKLYTTSFDDTQVVVDTTYYYSIVACFSSGCSGTSLQNSGFATLPPPTIPGTPAKPSATDGTVNTGIQVTWSDVATASFYQIYRSESDSTSGTLLASVSSTSYLDKDITTDKLYYYQVTACIVEGCSGRSETDSGFVIGLSTRIGVAVENTSFTWSVSGNASWYVVDGGQTGATSVRSGSIGNGETSRLLTQVLGPGEISFFWKVSSETTNDTLGFFIDQVLTGTPISGEAGWVMQNQSIPPGIHELSWVYSKNAATASGTDAGWLDSVGYVGCDTIFDSVILDSSNISIGGSITLGEGATLEQNTTRLLAEDPRCITTLNNMLVKAGSHTNLSAPTVALLEGFQVESGASFYAGVPLQIVGDWAIEGTMVNEEGSTCAFPPLGDYAHTITFAQQFLAIEYHAFETIYDGDLSGSQLNFTDIRSSTEFNSETEHVFAVAFSNNGSTLTGMESWRTVYSDQPGIYCKVVYTFTGKKL